MIFSLIIRKLILIFIMYVNVTTIPSQKMPDYVVCNRWVVLWKQVVFISLLVLYAQNGFSCSLETTAHLLCYVYATKAWFKSLFFEWYYTSIVFQGIG